MKRKPLSRTAPQDIYATGSERAAAREAESAQFRARLYAGTPRREVASRQVQRRHALLARKAEAAAARKAAVKNRRKRKVA